MKMAPGTPLDVSLQWGEKDITRAQLIALGKEAELKAQDAKVIIERVELAIGNWQLYASEYGVSQDSTHMITKSLAGVGL